MDGPVGAKSGKKKVSLGPDTNSAPKSALKEAGGAKSGRKQVNLGAATSGPRSVSKAAVYGDKPQRPTGTSKSAGHRVTKLAVDLPVRGKTGARRLPSSSTSGPRRNTLEADIAREHWIIAKNVLHSIHFEKSFATLHTAGGGEISLSQVR